MTYKCLRWEISIFCLWAVYNSSNLTEERTGKGPFLLELSIKRSLSLFEKMKHFAGPLKNNFRIWFWFDRWIVGKFFYVLMLSNDSLCAIKLKCLHWHSKMRRQLWWIHWAQNATSTFEIFSKSFICSKLIWLEFLVISFWWTIGWDEKYPGTNSMEERAVYSQQQMFMFTIIFFWQLWKNVELRRMTEVGGRNGTIRGAWNGRMLRS